MLHRFNAVDEQQTQAKIEQDEAHFSNEAANAIGMLLLLDAPEMSDVMDVLYRMLMARHEARNRVTLDDIPW